MASKIPDSWSSVTFNKKRISNEITVDDNGLKRKRKKGTSSTEVNEKDKCTDCKIEPVYANYNDTDIECKFTVKKNIIQSTVDNTYRGVFEDHIHNAIIQEDKRKKMLEQIQVVVSKNLQDIIAQTKYKEVLSGVNMKDVTWTKELQCVSKVYEDSYLRQKIATDERDCIRGKECECMFIDPAMPFVCVEYKMPWQDEKNGTQGMCLPCLRACTQALFYDIMHGDVVVPGVIQRFYNAHSTVGEYSLSSMLICPPNGPVHNLPMPIVRHQRNFYKVYVEHKIYYMQQIKVDF